MLITALMLEPRSIGGQTNSLMTIGKCLSAELTAPFTSQRPEDAQEVRVPGLLWFRYALKCSMARSLSPAVDLVFRRTAKVSTLALAKVMARVQKEQRKEPRGR
jgi:hypothetical protein